MPDLGKYAVWVLASYGVTLGLLFAITIASLIRAAQVRRALAEVEAARARSGAGQAGKTEAPPVAEPADG